MAIPKREIVMEKARELFFEQSFRSGLDTSINPEENELLEGGYYASALSSLMRNEATKNQEWRESENSAKSEVESESFLNIINSEEFLISLLRGGLCVFGASGTGKTILVQCLVKMLTRKRINCYIVDPSTAWLNSGFNVVEVSKDQKKYNWKTQTTVFDVCRLNQIDKVSFADTVCAALVSVHLNGFAAREILVLEESETFLQNSVLRSKKCENLMNLLAVGRNFNLRYVVIGQAPALIDKVFLKLCELKFYGFLNELNDLNCLKRTIGKTWTEQVTKLDVGEFVFQSKHVIRKVKVDLQERRQTQGFNFEFTYNPFL
jgi:Cdc6-like AAA superfamily ATPase